MGKEIENPKTHTRFGVPESCRKSKNIEHLGGVKVTISRNVPEQPTEPLSESMTIANAADSLGCSPATIRTMIFKGELKAYRVGVSGRFIRILKSDFAALWKPLTISGGGMNDI